jgi:hypothetical protein
MKDFPIGHALFISQADKLLFKRNRTARNEQRFSPLPHGLLRTRTTKGFREKGRRTVNKTKPLPYFSDLGNLRGSRLRNRINGKIRNPERNAGDSGFFDRIKGTHGKKG